MGKGKKIAIVVVVIAIVAVLGAAGVAWASKTKETKDADATQNATILVDGVQFEYNALSRGTSIAVTGAKGDFYEATISQNGSGNSVQSVSVLVPKSFVRLSSETAPAAWAGFAEEGAKLYKTVALSGEEIATLEKNAPVTVEDSFAGMLFVKTEDGKSGYTSATAVSKEKAEEETDDQDSAASSSSGRNTSYYGYWEDNYSYDDGGSDYSGGGSSGGGYNGGGSSGGSGSQQTTSGDGGDISLSSVVSSAAKAALGIQVAEAATAGSSASPSASSSTSGMSTSATILGDGVMSYLGIFNRGDVVQVRPATESTAYTVDVIFDDITKPIEKRLVRLENEAGYSTWTGYSTADAPLFSDYKLTSAATTLALNTELKIVDNLKTCYVVDVNGAYFYIATDRVSTVKIEEPEKESEEAAEGGESSASSTNGGGYYYSYSYDYSYDGGSDYSGGGDSGGGSGSSGGSSGGSGNSGGGGSSGGGNEWTAPVL